MKCHAGKWMVINHSRHAGFRHSGTMKRRRPYLVPPAAGHPSRGPAAGGYGRGEANGASRAVGNCCCSPLSAVPRSARPGEDVAAVGGRGGEVAVRPANGDFQGSRHAGFRHSGTMKRRRPYPVPASRGHPSRSGRGEANGDSRAAGNCCCSPLSACGEDVAAVGGRGGEVAVRPANGDFQGRDTGGHGERPSLGRRAVSQSFSVPSVSLWFNAVRPSSGDTVSL
jgi:hypothetical protein